MPYSSSELIASRFFWFKVIESVICVTCTSLIIDPAKITGLGKSHLHHFTLVFTTFVGYMLIIVVQLAGRLVGDRMPYRTSAIFSIVGAGMNLAAGTLLMADRAHFTSNYIFHPNKYYMDIMCSSAVFAFLNSVIFALDAICTFRHQKDL